MSKYYKVVFETNGRLESYARVVRNGSFGVEYKIDQWVIPKFKHTKLYVFDSIENATEWLHQDSGPDKCVRLFECHVKNPVKNFQVAKVHYIADFWNRYFNFRKKHKKVEMISHKNIPGTVGCSAVKLVKEIPIAWRY